VPYADWNTLKFADRDRAVEKMLDLTIIMDIFPTGYDGCVEARMGPGRWSTSAAAGRWGWRRPRRRCCSGRPWSSSVTTRGLREAILADRVPIARRRHCDHGCWSDH
jgi:hypothetical protein